METGHYVKCVGLTPIAFAFFGKIDYYSKYEFYGRLAEAANRQIKISDDLGVLLAMLDEIDKMRKEKFI